VSPNAANSHSRNEMPAICPGYQKSRHFPPSCNMTIRSTANVVMRHFTVSVGVEYLYASWFTCSVCFLFWWCPVTKVLNCQNGGKAESWTNMGIALHVSNNYWFVWTQSVVIEYKRRWYISNWTGEIFFFSSVVAFLRSSSITTYWKMEQTSKPRNKQNPWVSF